MNLHSFAETHEVFNQVPSLDGVNLYALDLPLQQWQARYQAAWAAPRLQAYGALAGGPLMVAGFLANEHKPQFHSHNRHGQRIDLVEFHPAYHQLMRRPSSTAFRPCPGPIRVPAPMWPVPA